MEMQPITLTRLIDKLCDNGWIERRGDETDRRVNRLYLKKAARPLLGKLAGLRSELTATALEGINPADAHRLLAQLEPIKENVRNAIQNPPERTAAERNSAMADPVLKFPPEQKGSPARRAAPETRRRTAPPPDGRHAPLPPLPAAGGAAAGGRDGRLHLLSQWRPLRDHRRRLCRRAEGADHVRRVRQDHQRHRQGRPAGLDRRHPVPDRSGAVSARRWRRRAPSSRTPRPATPISSPTSSSTRRPSKS